MSGSGPGGVLDDDLRESDDVDYAEEDTLEIGDEGESLLSDPAGYIRELVLGLLVGGILSAVTIATSFGLSAISAVTGALSSSGSAVSSSVLSIQSTAIDTVLIPFTLLEGLAASSGPFAPLVVGAAWALTAAVVAGLIWGLIRVVRFI